MPLSIVSKIADYGENQNNIANKAYQWLLSQPAEHKFLFEQNCNLGDTLHLTPIIRHYRLLYPDAAIAFIVGRVYLGAHEFNPDVNHLYGVPNLNPKQRIEFRKHLLTFKNIKMIAPSIFPYGEIWKELSWSHSDIASQYFSNAGINDLKPLGGRKLIVTITDQDRNWAQEFIKSHNLNPYKTCIIEYNSYSNQPVWRALQFQEFTREMGKIGFKTISIAGPKEKPISGSINATGISWRQTVALMNLVSCFVGVGSGLTMLAASADHKPLIVEIAVDDPVNMNGCGYAKSLKITNPNPTNVAHQIRKELT